MKKERYTKKKNIKCWKCHASVVIPDVEPDITVISICPHCNALYPEKPINEANLTILQEQYLVNRDMKTLNKMMIMMQDIAYNLICSKLKGSGKFLEEEDIMDKVQWTLLKMTHYYVNKPEFKITTSFVEYMSQVVLYPLYNYKTKEKDQNEISINTPIGSKGKGSQDKEQTLLDKISDQPYLDGNFEVENYLFGEMEKENTIRIVQDFIKTVVEVAEQKKGFSNALKLMLLYKHYLNKKEKSDTRFFNEWWKTEGIDLRDSFEKSLALLRRVLYDSAKA